MHDQILRTGVLFKKGSGNGPFGRKNWKPRYFVLTPTKLKYYAYEEGELKGEVDLTGCDEHTIEIMPADSMKTGSSASTIWRVAINSPERRLLVAAGTEMEMNDWVEQLLNAFRINSGQPPVAPLRGSLTNLQQPPSGGHVPGSIAVVDNSDLSRHSITDFQNFAGARKSVGGHIRASMGVHAGHEFRLSDEAQRQQGIEQERQEQQRQMAAERKREEEALRLHLKEQEAQRLQAQKEYEAQRATEDERKRHEALLDEQRRQKREQHERERMERERQMREEELLQQEKQHERQLQEHFDDDDGYSSPAIAHRGSHDSTKKDAMHRQQQEHQRRREATIKEQQNQMRKDYLAQKKRQDDELRASHVKSKPASPPRPQPQRDLKSVASVEF